MTARNVLQSQQLNHMQKASIFGKENSNWTLFHVLPTGLVCLLLPVVVIFIATVVVVVVVVVCSVV